MLRQKIEEPEGPAVEVRDERLQLVLAEYAYVGHQQRDEVSRLFQSWIALVALISVTTAFLGSDFAKGNFAIIAPFGIIAWCLMELTVITGMYTRRTYLAYLEEKANRLAGAKILEYETRELSFWAPIQSDAGISPWFLIFGLLGLLLLGLYVSFGIVAWSNLTSAYIKAILVVLMTSAALALLGLVALVLRRIERRVAV